MKIECDLKIQNLNLKINCNQEKLHKSCKLGLYRPRDDEEPQQKGKTNEIVLTIEGKWINAKYKLKRIETYTKFINEGKATLKLIDETIYLLLSNCPALTLINFISFINVKMSSANESSSKATKPSTDKENPNNNPNAMKANSSKAFATRLLERAECKLGPSHLKNISPLCEQDLNAIVQKRGLKRSLESPISARTAPPATKPKVIIPSSFRDA
jgi:hypothetical protein